MSAQVQCVRFHESTNGLGSANVWQFQGSAFKDASGLDGWAGSYPRNVQNDAAWHTYLARGWEPWLADYGVCGLGR